MTPEKINLEGEKPKGKILTKAEGAEVATSNTAIKRKTTGKKILTKHKRNLTIRLISARKNGYPKLIRR